MNDAVICYPFKVGASKWEDNELRHSLRSVERYWKTESGGLPRVVVLSESLPEWLTGVEHVKAVTYREALTKASQLDCERIVWMNDDILFLKDTREEDLKPTHLGEESKEKIAQWRIGKNKWRRNYGRAQSWLAENGYSNFNFSTHKPYLYELEKMRSTLERTPWFGNKSAFENYYFNIHHSSSSSQIRNKWRPHGRDLIPANIEEKRFLNLTDKAVGVEKNLIRYWVRGCFKDPSRYE